MKTHITAERQGGQPPTSAVAINVMRDFRAESERKGVHFDAAPAPDQKMTHFMAENDEAEYKNEGKKVRIHGPEQMKRRHDNSRQRAKNTGRGPYGLFYITMPDRA